MLRILFDYEPDNNIFYIIKYIFVGWEENIMVKRGQFLKTDKRMLLGLVELRPICCGATLPLKT